MQDGSTHEQQAWARWQVALVRLRGRTTGGASRREHCLWLLAHICGFGLLSYAMGYAVRRDGPWSGYVIGDGLVIACTLALIVLRLWALHDAGRDGAHGQSPSRVEVLDG